MSSRSRSRHSVGFSLTGWNGAMKMPNFMRGRSTGEVDMRPPSIVSECIVTSAGRTKCARTTPRRRCGTAARMTTTGDASSRLDAPIPLRGCEVALSPMGLGTWAWGDRATWGMNGYDQSYNLDTIRGAFARAAAAGITLLDTAEMYGDGESERIIGQLLREDSAQRDRM